MTLSPARTHSNRRLRRNCFRAALGLAVVLLAVPASTTASAAPAPDPYLPSAPRALPGWQADFRDDFTRSLNTSIWGRYQGGRPTGSLAYYQPGNVVVDPYAQVGDGVLKITTKKVNGTWTTGGLSSGRGFWATQGKWVVKAKFDRAHGVSYNFLLMPKGGGWPPEVNIAEGTAGGPHIMSVVHYGTATNHRQVQHWLRGIDMTKWHTYGVTMSNGVISYTIDGRVWATVQSTAAMPTVPLWFGIQAGVKDCARSTGECLSTATPTSSTIWVDWVAHYK
jgi:beta-glucanase (GH16 family)